ncbi:hypothetical protein [Vibrio fortis]|nr:hypothetical protein [Vibrio fortis]
MNLKYLKLLSLILISGHSLAASLIDIPSPPSSPSSYDEVRTSDGASCRSSVGGNIQMYGGLVTTGGDDAYIYNSDFNETGGYIGFAYSMGGGERLNCSRLAEIETEKALIELNKLKSEIKHIERLRKIQLMEAEGKLKKRDFEDSIYSK